MKNFLNKIRKPFKDKPLSQKIFDTLISFMGGFILGLMSKILDLLPLDFVHDIFNSVDLGEFFSRISIWLLLALLISIVSKTPLRAALNVFVFYIGMLFSYYAYSYIVIGYCPKIVVIFWLLLALISPILSAICWYAKSESLVGIILGSVILSIFFVLAFAFDLNSFRIRHSGLEAINWLIAVGVLYKSPKQISCVILLSAILAVIMRFIYVYVFMGEFYFGFMQF